MVIICVGSGRFSTWLEVLLVEIGKLLFSARLLVNLVDSLVFLVDLLGLLVIILDSLG